MTVDKSNEILLIVQLFPFGFKKKWKAHEEFCSRLLERKPPVMSPVSPEISTMSQNVLKFARILCLSCWPTFDNKEKCANLLYNAIYV